MTARWRSGAEIAPQTVDAEFSGGGLTNISQDSTIKRSGSYSLKFTGVGHNGSTRGLNMLGAAARAYIYLAGTPTTASPIIGFWSPTGATLASLAVRTDRTLALYLGYTTTLLAASTFTIPTGSFDLCLEVWVDTATRIIATRCNGTEWARVPVAAFTEVIDAVWFGNPSGLGTTIYFDDMAINSLAGSDNNGWPGSSAGGVLTFRPSGTAEAGWVAVGAPTIHECVDDLAPDLGATYIRQVGLNAAAGLYFPAWPFSVPASCAMLGLLGSSDATTTLMIALRDPVGDSSTADTSTTLSPGWQRRYPVATVERAWDGTRRLLNNGYLMPASSGARWRCVLIRGDAIAAQQYIDAVWMTVDFPLALAAAPVPVPVRTATALVQLELP